MQILVILAATMFLTGGGEQSNDAAKKSLEKLQGTWAMVGGEEVGERFTKDDVKMEPVSFVFKEDKLTVIRDGKEDGVLTVLLDPSTKPATIDLLFTDEKHRGEKILGIYALADDELQICLNTKFRPSKKHDPRPTEFVTKSGGPGRLLFVLKRDKK
jgi:uncharacterized protein (TIGR03067 family)